jgi:hypothetical protein
MFEADVPVALTRRHLTGNIEPAGTPTNVTAVPWSVTATTSPVVPTYRDRAFTVKSVELCGVTAKKDVAGTIKSRLSVVLGMLRSCLRAVYRKGEVFAISVLFVLYMRTLYIG